MATAAASAGPAGTARIRVAVWHDRNRNGRADGREPRIPDATADILGADGVVVASGRTGRDGEFEAEVPAVGEGSRGYTVELAPPPGFHPTTPCVTGGLAPPAGGAARAGFGVTEYRTVVLSAPRIRALVHCDLMERDWSGTPRGAHRDQDLVAGADAAGTDQLSVWFNRFDSSTLFNSARDYARTVPNTVLSLAAGALTRDPAPFADRPDLVAGTRRSGAGNVFLWFNQNTTGNEGHVRTTYSLGYETLDRGDVQAIVTGRLSGGPGVDWAAGTRSGPGRGSVEIWASDGAASPEFTRFQAWTAADTAGTPLGEVVALALARLDPGATDLIVGTRTGEDSGQIVIFRRGDGEAVFRPAYAHAITGAVTSLAICDLTRDGAPDLVVGVREGPSRGRIELWTRGPASGSAFGRRESRPLPAGYPVSLASGDLGGDPGPDVACGFRSDDAGTAGGILVYHCDRGGLPARGVDPSAGTIAHVVPALTIADFDRGEGVASAPGDDIAAGVAPGPVRGSIVLFIR
jgi:hypothetical protein